MPTTTTFEVSWEELSRLEFSFGTDEAQASRYGIVAATSFRSFRRGMLGYSKIDADRIKRYLPERHPHFEGLYAQQIEFVEPMAVPDQLGDGASLSFNELAVRINYKTLPYMPRHDEAVMDSTWGRQEWQRYVVRREDFSVESIILPKAALTWQGDTTSLPEPGAFVTPAGTAIWTWFQVPATLEDNNAWVLPSGLRTNWGTVIGKINSATFLGYPPKTLLCLAPSYVPVVQPDGTWAFNVNFQCAIRGRQDVTGYDATPGVPSPEPNWDRLYRPGSTPGWYRVVRKDDITKSIYETADFRKLFKVSV